MPLLSRLNPANIIPSFPPYLGPYAVGSFEVEIPVTSLTPQSADGIAETVQFRIFYPTQRSEIPASGWRWRAQEDLSSSKQVRWLPEPHQREYLSAYARFLGAGSGLAEIVSHVSRPLNYISLPAIADAPLLPPLSPDHRFPTMIFSHGLGGTRLAYSHICCSIASFGVVVVAPEHRDGSAPVSFVKTPASDIRIPGATPSSGDPGIDESSVPRKYGNGRVQVDYLTYPHEVIDETANGRNRQLEIRFREINLIYSALARLDLGQIPVEIMVSTDERKLLDQLKDRLDIHTPGRVIWAGHSFGASTMFQLVKSIHYTAPPELASNGDFKPLFTPEPTLPDDRTLPLSKQITESSPLMILDLWCLPLLGRRTSHLFKQPLPQIKRGNPTAVLAVMSSEFRNWKENLSGVRRVLSADPGRRRGGNRHRWFELWDDEHEHLMEKNPRPDTGDQIVVPLTDTPPTPLASPPPPPDTEPRFFYALRSAHLSQSDFGILFPRAIRKAEDPRRILELNVRAAVQWLREAGFVLGGERDVIFVEKVEGWSRIGLGEGKAEVETEGEEVRCE